MRLPHLRQFGAVLTTLLISACASMGVKPDAHHDLKTATPTKMTNQLDIPYTKKVLANGLTVIVHEDHKTPIVNVTVWYHVGSKDEGPGKTGFAHLFEHLMFQGTKHYNDDFFRPLEEAGATQMNGTTGYDATNYFQNLPTPGLDLGLWMESDRMGYLLDAIDQGKLDEQRGVVKNEKRQRESVPYGRVWDLMAERTYPKGHPYSWTPIGSEKDLDAASLADVKHWFETYYGAANAVLVITGDVNTNTALAKAEQYFGHIQPGPAVSHAEQWVAPMESPRRDTMEDQVAQGRIYKAWNVPAWGTRDEAYLELLSDVLSQGKTSRLYKRLVNGELATDVAAEVDSREIGSQFLIWATARPGVPVAKLEQAIDEELERLRQEGPTQDELERVQTSQIASFTRGLEHIGGFDGKSQWLAQSEIYTGDPGAWRKALGWMTEASSAQVRDAARQWLGKGVYSLEVVPYGDHKPAAQDAADRSKLPSVSKAPALKLPALTQTTLSNGMKVLLASRHDTPLIEFRLLLEGGGVSDPADREGLASFAMGMLDEGTANRSAQQIAEEEERLGANLWASSSLDAATVGLSSLRDKLDPSLDLFADVIRHPAFPQDNFARMKQRRLAAIAQEKTKPTSLAMRLLPPLLYGTEHPYGRPFTGTGREQTVQAISRDDLKRYHDTWFKPEQATLIVVGDTDMAHLKPALERVFGDWHGQGSAPAPVELPQVSLAKQPRVYLVNRPDYEQTTILAGSLTSPTGAPNDISVTTINAILGGMFTSRINMNLREDKHWTYGARSVIPDARGQRPLLLYASVERAQTAPAIQEIIKEINGIRGVKLITPLELSRAQQNLTLSLPGENETSAQVSGSYEHLQIYHLPQDYYTRFVEEVQQLKVDDVRREAHAMIDPQQLTWVIIGDLSRIGADVRSLNLGPVQVLDAEGKPMPESGVGVTINDRLRRAPH